MGIIADYKEGIGDFLRAKPNANFATKAGLVILGTIGTHERLITDRGYKNIPRVDSVEQAWVVDDEEDI